MNDKILCDKCVNTEICKYREKYKQIRAAVANLTICEETAEGAHSIRKAPVIPYVDRKVSDIPYIDVIVDCKHFRRAPRVTEACLCD